MSPPYFQLLLRSPLALLIALRWLAIAGQSLAVVLAEDLKSPTVEIREADYDRPATLVKAFTGVDKLLLISANDLSGVRLAQHKAAIDAAKSAGVKLIAYTSILHTDTSELILTEEHRATEAYLKASGVPHVLLRNGWYTENETAASHGSSALQRPASIRPVTRWSKPPRSLP